MRSSTIDLTPYARLMVKLTGVWDTHILPAALEVSAVEVTGSTFNIQGNGRLGTDLRFSVDGPRNDIAVTFIAGGNGFIPVLDTTGLLLNLPTLLMLDVSLIDSQGNVRFDVTIPGDQSLVGARIYGQSLVLSTVSPAWSTDPRVAVIRA